MTVPPERKHALNNTREFLVALLDPAQTKRIPSEIRRWAAMCIRHYPHSYEIDELAELAPHLLGPEYWYPRPKKRRKKNEKNGSV